MWGWLGGLGAGQVHSEDSQEVTAANRRRGQTFGNFFIFQNRLSGKILMIFSQLYREVPGKEAAPSFFKNIAYNTAEYFNQGDPCFYVKLPK